MANSVSEPVARHAADHAAAYGGEAVQERVHAEL